MASVSNSRWQNCKERPNRPANNGDIVEIAKRYVVCKGVSGSMSDSIVREKPASKKR